MKRQSDPTDPLEACGNIALLLEEEKEYTLKLKLNTNLSGKKWLLIGFVFYCELDCEVF